MLVKHARHIALTSPLAAWINAQVIKGEYTSASDLARTAIRSLQKQSAPPLLNQAASQQPSAAHDND